METGQSILDPVLQFTALVTIALVVQLTIKRFQIPGLIGLLLIGMLLGPGGLGTLPREPIVEFLGDIGLIYVMFVAGLEIDLDIVRTHTQETIVFGLLAFGCSLAPTVGVGLLLGYPLQAAILLGSLLSSHTLLSYPIVQRLGLVHRHAVVAAIGGTLLTDTLALLLLAAIVQNNDDAILNFTNSWGWLVPLVLLGLLAAVTFWGLPRLSRAFFNRPWISNAEKALFVIATLLLLASATEIIGTEDILGAFLAGICLNQVLAEQDYLREHIEFVGRLLFIPFFFLATGMLLEIEVFIGELSIWLLAMTLLILVLVGKTLASWLAGMLYGYEWQDRVLMIGLTVPQAAATLAVTITAREAQFFGEEVVDAVIIVIFVTCLLGPLLVRYMGKKVSP